MKVLVAVKRVIDYAVKVRVSADKTGASNVLLDPWLVVDTSADPGIGDMCRC
jgi:hypothetical protein